MAAGWGMTDAYRKFLEAKVAIAPRFGFDVADADIHPLLKPHQRAIVRWMIAGGRRACFAAFGLGKTVIQLEVVRLTMQFDAHGFARSSGDRPLFDAIELERAA